MQFDVISTQQTTLCRLKLGPASQPTLREKLKNFKSFLFNRKILVANTTHYFQHV